MIWLSRDDDAGRPLASAYHFDTRLPRRAARG